jgi:hypothetical protein
MSGDILFVAGALLEYVGLYQGVTPRAVAWSLIIYGVILLYTGYKS